MMTITYVSHMYQTNDQQPYGNTQKEHCIISRHIYPSFSTGSTLFNRVPRVREKSVKNEKSSRSGKSQGILI